MVEPANKRGTLGYFTRESLSIEVELSLTSVRVIRSLEQIIEWREKPWVLQCDHGPEYISHELIDWANRQQITFIYIQSGKPTQNAYIVHFNPTARHERLELYLFETSDLT